ncbi:MAG: hypothetical protein V4480_00585 [Patescibacteria group bacterium]
MEDDTFNYFNVDINLLALHVLLEGAFRGQSIFTLERFLKGNYWKIEEIEEDIRDTNDYSSVEDLVMHQVIGMVEALELGTVKRVSVANLYGLTEQVAREAVETKDGTEDDVAYYSSLISELYDLRKKEEEQFRERLDAGLPYSEARTNRADFTKDDFGRHIQIISAISTPFIELEIDFDELKTQEADKLIHDYIHSFSQDDYIEKKPFYRQKRFYFSKQLENFFEYIQRFPEIDGYVNIPFSALSEQGFEVVKVMTYLEREARLKVRNWDDIELWNVKFHKTPITLASLLGQETKTEIKAIDKSEIKLNLSFSPETAMMSLTDQTGTEYKVRVQGQVQKEVLRVIFKNPKDTYTEWSLYDISELLGGQDVNETAVKNAIYQFNKKTKLHLPQVENLFELTKHSARLNPKYVSPD